MWDGCSQAAQRWVSVRSSEAVLRKVQLKRQRVDVAAPRDLLFEVVASAGKTISSTERGNLVEFETRVRDKVVKTVEEVVLDPPHRIGYRWVEGVLDDVEEEIRFESTGPHESAMTYSGRFGAQQGVTGWLRGLVFVRPIFNRLVGEHLLEGKRIAEKRAQRSSIHPPESPAGRS